LPEFVSRPLAFAMDFVPGRPFSSDNYRSLSVDSVCSDDGFALLGIKPRSMLGVARQYLGVYEDNARLSRDRAAIGRTS
jgi:NADH dehydrogenase